MIESSFQHHANRIVRRHPILVAAILILIACPCVHAKEGHATPLPKPAPKFETPIHAAALEGNLPQVLQLLDNGWDVNTVSPVRGDTPLFVALERKHADMVNALLDRGANVNFAGMGQSTPLHHAAIWGNTEIIERLLKMGANPAHVDDSHHLPLHYAVKRGSVEAVKLLLVRPGLMDKDDTHERTPLDHAIDLSDPEIALILLDAGAHFANNPNRTLSRIGICATKGWTEAVVIALNQTKSQPDLHQRVAERAYNDTFAAGNVPQLKRIAELVPNIAATKPTSGLPRLFIAANFGHVDMVAALLEQGSPVNEAALPSGWTALHGALIDSGNPKLVNLLLRSGADADAADGIGRTPLHIAAIARRPAVMPVLIKSGADPAHADDFGNTPLHYAVLSGNVPAVQVLVDAKSPQNANRAGRTPHDLAIDTSRPDLAALLEAPAPVVLAPLPKDFDEITALAVPGKKNPTSLAELRDQWAHAIRQGTPLLHLAAQAGSLDAVQQLLRDNPDGPTQRDASGLLALHVAAEGTAAEIVTELIAANAPVNDQGNLAKWSPLHFAAAAGQPGMVKVLLDNGANSALRDSLGRTPGDIAELLGLTSVTAQLPKPQ